MKKLFKTLVTVITVMSMLLVATTAFAASAGTVTQYNEDNNVTVTSTITGVAADTIVTYIAAVDADDNGYDASEIKYINQATSDGSDITFSYSLTGSDWTSGATITEVKYGSDDSEVAAALNTADTTNDVLYDDIDVTVTVNGAATSDAYTNYVTLSPSKIGNADEEDVAIEAVAGYEIASITIGDVAQTATSFVSTYKVAYGQEVVVDVKPGDGVNVYLLDAEVTDGLTVYDASTDQALEVVTGVGYYTGSVKTVGIQFGTYDIDGAHDDGKYEAVLKDASAQAGYFAVQLAGTDMTGVAATAAYATDANDVAYVSANE